MTGTNLENDGLPALHLGDDSGVLRFRLLRRPSLMMPPSEEAPSDGNLAEAAFRAGDSDRPDIDRVAADAVAAPTRTEGCRSRRKLWCLAGAGVLATALAVFFALGGVRGSKGGAAVSPVSGNFAVEEGRRVPAFRGLALAREIEDGAGDVGGVFSSDDLLGTATVLLAWSARDEDAAERLTRLTRLTPALENADDRPIRVLTLNLDASPEAARVALERAQADELFTLFDRHPSVDPADRVSARLRIVETPWLFLFDERGHLEDADLGMVELAALGTEDGS